MRHKKGGFVFLLVFSLVIYLPVIAGGQLCPKKARGGCGLEKKILCRFHMAIANQDKLNLSDDQVAKIKAVKMSMKKDLIKRQADIDLVSVDVKSKLGEEKIDEESICKLIDKKYELKKEKAKALVDAYVELNNILSVEQKKELHKIKCQGSKCPGKSHGKCPRGQTLDEKP